MLTFDTFNDSDFNNISSSNKINFEFESDKKNSTIQLSPYQQKIIDDFQSTSHNMFISARAGAAKTFTLIELTKYTNQYSVFLAFNKSIQKELEERITNPKFKTYTFNGLGYLIMLKNIETQNSNMKVTIDKYKTRNVVTEILNEKLPDFEKLNYDTKMDLIDNFSQLFEIGKSRFIDFTNKKDILYIIDTYDLFSNPNAPMPKDTFTYIDLIEQKNNEYFEQTGIISFGDQLYITLKKLFKKEWTVPPYLTFQNIFVDEAQDTNSCQQLLISCIKRNSSRIICVADKFQAIYGFNGADTVAVNNLIKKFDMVEYALPINYRCASSHIDYVNKLFPDIDIKACSTAPQGKVQLIHIDDIYDLVQNGDFILSRRNSDLCDVILVLLSQGKPVYFKDVNFVNKILSKIKTLSKKSNTLNDLYDHIEKEQQKITVQLQKKKEKMLKQGTFEETELDKLTFTNETTDLFDCVIILLEHYMDDENIGNKTVEHFYQYVSNMLNTVNSKNSIVCTSIHQSKGLETNNVFVLNEARPFYHFGRNAEQRIQERNLSYVALTRAKQNLYLVKSEDDI